MADNGNGRKRKNPDGYTCDICSKRIKCKSNYNRHVRSHESKHICSVCDQSFYREDTLQRHQRGHFAGYKPQIATYTCSHCGNSFNNNQTLFQHVNLNHSSQQGGGDSEHSHHIVDKLALNNKAGNRYIHPNEDDKYDLLRFFTNIKQKIEEHLKQRCQQLKHLKWYLNVQLELIRESNTGEKETADPHFHSGTFILLSEEDDSLEHNMNECFQKIFKSFDEFVRKGSAWTLKKVISLQIHTVQYKPLGGSSYIELPRTIIRTGGIVNINNDDDKCFLWSVLASLHPSADNAHRVQKYTEYEGELDMTGIPYPVTLANMSKFEKQNNISINVLGYEQNQLFPLYISSLKGVQHEVDLLYLQNSETSHYCWIKNLNRALASTKTRSHNHYFCRHCLQGFQRRHTLEKHVKYCSRYDMQCTTLPETGKDDKLRFTDYHKQLRVPFVIYADFETFAQQMDSCEPDPKHSSTTPTVNFEACGYGYQVVCVDDMHTQPPVVYRGDDVSSHFIQSIMEEGENIKEILSSIVSMDLTSKEEQCFRTSTRCHICNKTFNKTKVRDHCHVSGKYRGAACQSCNLNFKHPKFIPVIFHNLRNFDAHILCETIGQFKGEDITCIPNNMEKYVSFSLGQLRFIDSYQFVNCSLSEMVSNLATEGLSHFTLFNKEFTTPDEANLLLRKGVYPYEYMNGQERFDETGLPRREAFYSHLSKSHISEEDYKHAQTVWETMKISNMGEYHDLYLKTDVLLLADCFERFRDTCLQHYSLDPCHYFTAPGLAWSAALKMTDCELDLLTDPDMYLFFEKGIRGGISMISHKYAKANNMHTPGYDPTQPVSYISYLDANNLYGWAMRQSLPEKNFRWLTEKEVENFDVTKISKTSNKGYVLEVDMEYPSELHDKHNCYPLAPETFAVSNDMLSPYSCKLWTKLWMEHNTSDKQIEQVLSGVRDPMDQRVITPKLTPSLTNKTNYVIHYKNLKQYLKLGLKLTKIHRGIEFDQSPWLRKYIDFNTEQRKISRNDFEKAFFKLMNNSVFGKTMENLRHRVDIRLVHEERKLLKHSAKSSFKRFKIFNPDLVGVELKKVNLKLNKPVYAGQTILDLSKTLMYRFHYMYMCKKYGEHVKLCFTDTDSLCYLVETENVMNDYWEDRELFDLSNLPTDHEFYDCSNMKEVGKFKIETGESTIQSFVGLRSKMYSYKLEHTERQVAKGISKATIKNDLRHDQYTKCLFERTSQMCNMSSIRSHDHQLSVQRINKSGLCAFDDKRYVLDDGVTTLAHGHYKIETMNQH